MIGHENGRGQIKKGATIPKLEEQMDASTKIASAKTTGESFQPIAKEDGPSLSK